MVQRQNLGDHPLQSHSKRFRGGQVWAVYLYGTCCRELGRLFYVPGPRDDANWVFGVDFLRDFCDEIKVQPQSLIHRVHDLLPTDEDLSVAHAPFNTIEMIRTERHKGYMESSTGRIDYN
ncbi:hypothetical protein Aduo_016149 [Ancylostoma duodenale]